MNADILAIGAHPDDVELACSGTIAKEISAGKKVVIIDLTKGELGTRGSEKIRELESKKAGEILKISDRKNLGLKDGFFHNSDENKIKLVRLIRFYKPKIVLCNSINDRHPDHGRASKLVVESCFLSGLKKVTTKFQDIAQQPWKPLNIYHYVQWNLEIPDFIVDISDFMDIKLKSVKCYSSQFYDPESKEPKTPISTQNFLESIKYRSANFGRIIGADYGEGFVANRKPAVASISDLI